jgi:hypothetical protein
MRSSRIDPIRQSGFLGGEPRRRVERECQRLDDELCRLDRQLAALAQRRQELAAERLRLHGALWPVRYKKRGRRPRPLGGDALPPLPADATWLHGRRLRGICLAVLAERGPLPLPELHAHLHRLGFGVDDPHAVKVLAEALAYEVDLGHARRVRWGVYELVPGTRIDERLPALPRPLDSAV